jgi:hypothetical protein
MTCLAYVRLELIFVTRDVPIMIFHIFITVFVLGFALLVGVLSVMRGLYACSVCQPPHIPSDAAPNPSFDEDHERLEISSRPVGSRQIEISTAVLVFDDPLTEPCRASETALTAGIVTPTLTLLRTAGSVKPHIFSPRFQATVVTIDRGRNLGNSEPSRALMRVEYPSFLPCSYIPESIGRSVPAAMSGMVTPKNTARTAIAYKTREHAMAQFPQGANIELDVRVMGGIVVKVCAEY